MFETSCYGGRGSATLKKAMLMYAEGDDKITFVSIHDIGYVNGAPFINAGTPATTESLKVLVSSLLPAIAGGKTLLPERVLSHDMNFLMWYTLPSVKQFWFNHEKVGVKVSNKVAIPGLVFFLKDGDWFVFAHKEKTRPTLETQLYKAPFMNIWEGGRICTGNITMPKVGNVNAIYELEDAFFNSYFTHTNTSELVSYKGGAYAMWKQLMKGDNKKLPLKALLPTNITLGKILENA